ncbi:MAG TPA: HAMP domain-containing sensor histidine kinase [Planctomycetota bacterium]|nr:HAMP domain-containing sensor histidine kinase [Planctomycetota bacterium]
MRSTRHSWWVVYGICALLALGALGWTTVAVLDLEAGEREAVAEADHQASLRLALWRMDSRIGPYLAREASRPFYEYEPYFPQPLSYTRMLSKIDPGEVLSPSPLLTFDSQLFPLHFQVSAGGQWSSPQAPTGNLLDLAQGAGFDDGRIERAGGRLDELRARVEVQTLRAAMLRAEGTLEAMMCGPPVPLGSAAAQADRDEVLESGFNGQTLLNARELTKRAQSQYLAQDANLQASREEASWLSRDQSSIRVGQFVPIWLAPEAATGSPSLLFLRRVSGGPGELLQGFLGDWEHLVDLLCNEIEDLFPAASLAPQLDEARADTRSAHLASLPARLEVAQPPAIGTDEIGPARVTLLASWIAVILALVAVGFTLHASIAFGEQRSRFASTVTHELRTPLTTFRMYSEMLAEDMVPAEKHGEYLETLQHEAARLSWLVENVLAYARLEEGRARARHEVLSLEDLVARVLPDLERRTAEVGAELVVDLAEGGRTRVETDPEAVGQILFNLVDNACKYGEPPLELSARKRTDGVELRVRDHGAGVPERLSRTIFRPFERGDRDPSDPEPGVGLGLALSRGLARDLGGDLVLEAGGSGACFRLTLRDCQ